MKKTLYLPGILFVAALLISSCGSSPESDTAQTGEAQEKTAMQAQTETESVVYPVQLEASQIDWVGSKKVGGRHTGFIKLKSGELYVKDNQIVGGRFVIDMNTITVTDIPADKPDNAKLTGHLKSADFFEVETYPEASFEITSITNWDPTRERGKLDPEFSIADPTHEITGNLKMKDVTKSISFPAKVVMNDGSITANARFNINRYDWNVNFRKGETVEDKIINAEINIGIQLQAQAPSI